MVCVTAMAVGSYQGQSLLQNKGGEGFYPEELVALRANTQADVTLVVLTVTCECGSSNVKRGEVRWLKLLDFWAERRMSEPSSGILACCSHQTRSPCWLEACLHQTLISKSSAPNAAVVDQVW